MKSSLKFAALLLLSTPCFGQDKGGLAAYNTLADMPNANAQHPLRTNNEVTPRWTVEANFRYGALDQNITLYDLKKTYGNLPQARYAGLEFKTKSALGGDLSLNYFFNKKHTLGVGIGVMYMQYDGTLSMSSFRADYEDVDTKGRTYRQWITSNGPISESITTTTLNVPLLLKFKNQFKGKFGIWADAGPVFGFYNHTKTSNAGANFDYEAIYRLGDNGVVSGIDNSPTGNPQTSLLLTKAQLALPQKTPAEVAALLDFQREKQGYNVGLNQSVARAQSTPENTYDKISFGGLIQAGFSWEITYRLAFNLGGYFMYQRYEREGGNKNRITDRVLPQGSGSAANYYGLSNAIQTSDYTSYGAMAGVRIHIGGKGRDSDGDGFTDDVDRCRFEWGTVNGCPDNDGDGIPNDQDDCPDEYGTSVTRGCPDMDGDGFADKNDSCVNVPGTVQGCPVAYWTNNRTMDTTLVAQNGTPMAPHVVLETDVLNFAFGKSALTVDAEKFLNDAAHTLESNPNVVIHISGYTDDIGTYANNLVLSLERAKTAKNYLTRKGVPENRIIIAGLGKENPAVVNDSPENRAKNRRIEMKLLLPLE